MGLNAMQKCDWRTFGQFTNYECSENGEVRLKAKPAKINSLPGINSRAKPPGQPLQFSKEGKITVRHYKNGLSTKFTKQQIIDIWEKSC